MYAYSAEHHETNSFVTRPRSTVIQWWLRTTRAARAHQQRKRDQAILGCLDPRLLEDIGVERGSLMPDNSTLAKWHAHVVAIEMRLKPPR